MSNKFKNGLNIHSRLDKAINLESPKLATKIITNSKLVTSKHNNTNTFEGFFGSYAQGLIRTIYSMDVSSIENLVNNLFRARAEGNQIFLIGNGGSAANASHMAADLAKDRFSKKELLFKIQSLVDNTPLLTATANDYGYENIFVEPLKRLMNPKDLLIAISSSGNSENVLRAVDYANKNAGISFGIVGFGGGELKKLAHNVIDIPCKAGEYGFHEDACSIIYHMIIDYITEYDSSYVNQKECTSEKEITV